MGKKNSKRIKKGIRCEMTGKIIKPTDEVILASEAISYVRKLGYLVSNLKFSILILFMIILLSFSSACISEFPTLTYNQWIENSCQIDDTNIINRTYTGIYINNCGGTNYTYYNQTWLEFDETTYIETSIGHPEYEYLTVSLRLMPKMNDSRIRPFQFENNSMYSYIYGGAGNYFYCSVFNVTGTERQDTVTATNAINNWGTLTCMFNGSNIEAYYNGVGSGTPTTVNGNLKPSKFLNVGQAANGAEKWNGSISNIIVYNRSLEDREITYLHENLNIINNSLNLNTTVTQLGGNIQVPYCRNDFTECYGWSAGANGLRSSTNRFVSTSSIYDTSNDGITGIRSMFVDSNNNIYAGLVGNNTLYVSIGNSTNWSRKDIFVCDDKVPKAWGITEDNNSYIYVGEYQSVDYSSCAYIHRSTDGGNTWTIVYNDSSPTDCTIDSSQCGGRHIHNVKFNPYNNCLYATVGDGSASKLIKSCDAGSTWDILQNGSTHYNYIPMEFTPNYRIFGEDEYSSGCIVRTSDDINFENVFCDTRGIYWWSSTKDSNNVIYMSQTSHLSGYVDIYASSDEGDSWYLIENYQEDTIYRGYEWITMLSRDEVYFKNDTYAYRLNILDLTNPIIQLTLNENTGSTAYDLSNTGDNGTIVNGVWNNDGISNFVQSYTDTCNYCSYDTTFYYSPWTQLTNCTLGSYNQTRNVTQYDLNNATCYAITGLASDAFNLGSNSTSIENSVRSCSYPTQFSIDFNNFTAVVFALFFLSAILLVVFGQTVFGGGVFIVLGFTLLFSTFNPVLSFILIAGGVVTIFLIK